jgi:hypothetical protein
VNRSENERIAELIESRSPHGPNEMVQGWHELLKNILTKAAPFMVPGHLVTFQKLEDTEKAFFEDIHRRMVIPQKVTSIFLPPSVRHQMMYQRPGGDSKSIPEHTADNPPDLGIILACREADLDVIVNALMAKSPFTPAIDVYDHGELIAGYIYNTIDECISDLARVLRGHLK